jgi:hypothetical protein
MATYNTAYKSGTIASFDGTTVTVAGFTPDVNDIGRLVIITNGNAKLQHREIIGISGQDITIAHDWDSQPFIDTSSDKRASDVLPASGDSIAISYDAADLIGSDADMTLTNDNLVITGAIAVSGNAYIHFKNYNVRFAAEDIQISPSAGMIFGYYGYVAGEDGYVKDSCNVFDTATNQSGIRDASQEFGMLDMYGGNIRFTSNSSGEVFWRLYSQTSAPTVNQARMIDVTAYGPFGCRVDGNRSMMIMTAVGSPSTTGVANPRTAVARTEFTALGSLQGGYVFTDEGAEGRIVFSRLVEVTRGLRILGQNPDNVSVFEVQAKKSEIDSLGAFFNAASTRSRHSVRYGNPIKPQFTDGVNLITDAIKTRLYDSTNTFIEENSSLTGGIYPETWQRHTDVPTVSGDRTLTDGTQYAPYSLRSIQFGKQFLVTSINLEDTFDNALVMLTDTVLTELNQTTVDAYTELETPEKFYDRAVSWLESNITSEQSFLVTRSGDTIDAGSYDVIVDATTGSAFDFDGSTITIKTDTFTGNITTTGTITFANGATISGIAADNTGSTDFVTIENLDGAYFAISDDTGTIVDYQSAVTGSYTYAIGTSATGTWQVCIRRQGYAPRKVNFTIDNTGHVIDGTLIKRTNFDGSDTYTGVTDSLVTVNLDDPTTGEARIDIGNGQVPAKIAYNMAEDALVGMNGVCTDIDQVFQVDPLGFQLYSLSSNIQLRRELVGYTKSGLQGIVSHEDGTPVDETNGGVRIYSAPTFLTQQDVRDSMALAPTAGLTIALESLDAKADDILLDTDELQTNQGNWGTADVSALATQASVDTLESNVDAVKAKTDQLNFTGSDVQSVASNMRGTDGANRIAPDNASVAEILTDTGTTIPNQINLLNDLSASDVWTHVTRSLTDKVGFELTPAERTAIATATEVALINEGDGQQLIDAIVQVINSNLDLPALELQAIAAQVRSELSTELSRIDTNISSRSTFDPTADTVARVTLTDTTTDVTNSTDVDAVSIWSHEGRSLDTPVETDAASRNASKADLSVIAQNVWEYTTRSVTDKTGFSLTAAEKDALVVAIEAALINEGDGQQLINAIIQVINSNLDLPALELQAIATQVRAELSTELARIDVDISSRSTFDPATDEVITDAASREASKATGYATPSNVTQAQTNIQSTIGALENLSSAEVQNELITYGANKVAPDNVAISDIKAKTDQLIFSGSRITCTLDGEVVTVGTNQDKTGYSISGAMNTLDDLNITAGASLADIEGSTILAKEMTVSNVGTTLSNKIDNISVTVSGEDLDINLDGVTSGPWIA